MVEAEVVGRGVDGDVGAQVFEVLLLVAEGERPDPGVQPVGANDEVETPWGATPLWLMQFEMVVQADYVPELRKILAAGVETGRRGLAELFETELELGAFHQVMLSGMLTQWLIDPATAPTAAELTASLQKISRGLSPDA